MVSRLHHSDYHRPRLSCTFSSTSKMTHAVPKDNPRALCFPVVLRFTLNAKRFLSTRCRCPSPVAWWISFSTHLAYATGYRQWRTRLRVPTVTCGSLRLELQDSSFVVILMRPGCLPSSGQMQQTSKMNCNWKRIGVNPLGQQQWIHPSWGAVWRRDS